VDETPTPHEHHHFGLDSIADLRALERLLFYGLVVAIIVGAIVLAVARAWLAFFVLVAAYALIASIQWIAVHRRLRGKRDPR
jgi:membrane protein implicated in regulation of membrane protease activity